MSYIIRDNDVANDDYVMRSSRFSQLSANINDYEEELNLPEELLDWAVDAEKNWEDALKSLVRNHKADPEFQAAQIATAALKKKYQATKNLLKTRFTSPDDREIFGIAGRTPGKRLVLLAKARDMVNAHSRFADLGDPKIIPDGMINAVAALADDLETKHDDAYFQKDRGRKASVEVRAHYDRDTAMLRTFYRWCVAKWGRDSTNFIAIGFRDRKN